MLTNLCHRRVALHQGSPGLLTQVSINMDPTILMKATCSRICGLAKLAIYSLATQAMPAHKRFLKPNHFPLDIWRFVYNAIVAFEQGSRSIHLEN